MVHVSLHWSEYGADNLALWGFSVKHAVWLHNCFLNCLSSLTPLELLAKTKVNHGELLCTHGGGCPVCALDPKLQGG